MPHLDQTNPSFEFEHSGRTFMFEYDWPTNSVFLFVKDVSGRWVNINANTQFALDMIRKYKIKWGDKNALRSYAEAR